MKGNGSMKRTKRWMGCLAAALVSGAASALADTETVAGVAWSYDVSDGTATVTGASGMSGTVSMPDSLGGLPVTAIGEGAFYGSLFQPAVTLTIPESVTSVGKGAFGNCRYLVVSVPVTWRETDILAESGARNVTYWGNRTGIRVGWGGHGFLSGANGFLHATEDPATSSLVWMLVYTERDEVGTPVWDWNDSLGMGVTAAEGDVVLSVRRWNSGSTEMAVTDAVATAEPSESPLEMDLENGRLSGGEQIYSNQDYERGWGGIYALAIQHTVHGQVYWAATELNTAINWNNGLGEADRVDFDMASDVAIDRELGGEVTCDYLPVYVAGDIAGGTVRANKTIVWPEETVSLAVSPDPGMKLTGLWVNGEPIDGLVFMVRWEAWDMCGVFITAEFSSDVEWKYVVADGRATVTGAEPAAGSLVMPSTLGGYPVTGIGPSAFNGCSELAGMAVPDCVTDIGTNAFASCSRLATLYVPASWKEKVVDGTFWRSHAGVPATCGIVYRGSTEEEATASTPVAVPYSWLEVAAEEMIAINGGDHEAAAKAAAANGMPVWECYVAGVDPADAGAVFRAELSCEDGTWKAKPVGGEKDGRAYRVEGKRELADDGWTDVTDVEDVEAEGWRFFRVGVGMAE